MTALERPGGNRSYRLVLWLGASRCSDVLISDRKTCAVLSLRLAVIWAGMFQGGGEGADDQDTDHPYHDCNEHRNNGGKVLGVCHK